MSVFQNFSSDIGSIHPKGWPFILIFAVATFSLFFNGFDVLGWLGLITTIWCAYFFRDPERVTPLGEGLIIAPADGRICAIEHVLVPDEVLLGTKEALRVSIFMNVLNVHINRVPIDGRVIKINYIAGKFLNASLDKASLDNERQAFTIEAGNVRIGCVQIAGLIARRIVGFVAEGADVVSGQRLGLIRFGSRVDVYLPSKTVLKVALGQTMVAGETILADVTVAERSGGPRSEALEQDNERSGGPRSEALEQDNERSGGPRSEALEQDNERSGGPPRSQEDKERLGETQGRGNNEQPNAPQNESALLVRRS